MLPEIWLLEEADISYELDNYKSYSLYWNNHRGIKIFVLVQYQGMYTICITISIIYNIISNEDSFISIPFTLDKNICLYNFQKKKIITKINHGNTILTCKLITRHILNKSTDFTQHHA